jgi:hypothetical protein
VQLLLLIVVVVMAGETVDKEEEEMDKDETGGGRSSPEKTSTGYYSISEWDKLSFVEHDKQDSQRTRQEGRTRWKQVNHI